MASFEITISDELVPGLVAMASAEGKDADAFITEYAESIARKACQDMAVGPYWVGPQYPRFNADGTPYVAPATGDADELAPTTGEGDDPSK